MRLHAILAATVAVLCAGPSPAQPVARQWAATLPKQGDAVLSYALPNARDLTLGYSCAKRSGQIQIIAATATRIVEPVDPEAPPAPPTPVSRPATIIVTSEAAAAALPGRIMPQGDQQGSLMVTEISTASPVIALFRKNGLLRVGAMGASVDAPAVPKQLLRAFLKYCR